MDIPDPLLALAIMKGRATRLFWRMRDALQSKEAEPALPVLAAQQGYSYSIVETADTSENLPPSESVALSIVTFSRRKDGVIGSSSVSHNLISGLSGRSGAPLFSLRLTPPEARRLGITKNLALVPSGDARIERFQASSRSRSLDKSIWKTGIRGASVERCEAPAASNPPLKISDAAIRRIGISRSAVKSCKVGLELPRKAKVASRKAKGAFHPYYRTAHVRAMPLRILEDVPLTRRRLSAIATDFSREKGHLCRVARIEEKDLHWIGVFRLVPLAAAAALEVNERAGLLSIQLRPHAHNAIMRARAQFVTLAMGRNRASGEIVQALIRDPTQ